MQNRRVVGGAMACALLVMTGCASIPSFGTTAKKRGQDAEHIISVARLAERRGEFDAARKVYLNLIAEGLATGVAYHRLGVIAANENDLPRALRQFAASRAAGNDSVDLDIDIAYAHFLAGNKASADEMLSEALTKEPANKRALNNMAILRASQGRFDDCLAVSLRAVGPAKAHSNVGYLQSKFGDVDAAKNNFHVALAKDPDLKVAANALLQLEQPNLEVAPLPWPNMLIASQDPESSPQELTTIPTSGTPAQSASPSSDQLAAEAINATSAPIEATPTAVVRSRFPVRLASSQAKPKSEENIEEGLMLPAIHFQSATIRQTGEPETSESR